MEKSSRTNIVNNPVKSEEGNLPKQEKFFSASGLKGKVPAGTNLPDPRQVPEGCQVADFYLHRTCIFS